MSNNANRITGKPTKSCCCCTTEMEDLFWSKHDQTIKRSDGYGCDVNHMTLTLKPCEYFC